LGVFVFFCCFGGLFVEGGGGGGVFGFGFGISLLLRPPIC